MNKISILLINGPNFNLLGTCGARLYSAETLSDVEQRAKHLAASKGATLDAFQSNHEGAIVKRIQQARGNTDVILINPTAYTHTSVAIRDAVLDVHVPFVEIHLTNIHSWEAFRHHSCGPFRQSRLCCSWAEDLRL